MQKKKVSLIGTNGIPARYGGFETLTEYLAKYLNEDYDLLVYCSITPRASRLKEFHNSRLIYLPFKANGWQSMIYDAISIIHGLIIADVLVILGFSGVLAFPLRVFFKKKIVFNIGGIEWKKVRGKRIFASLEIASKKWFERICVHFSDVIITDNKVLWDYVKEVYNIESELVEYGGDHAVHVTINRELKKKYPFFSRKYDVTIARAQEDMNIHLIIEAYKHISDRNLVIVSNWDKSAYGTNLKSENKDKFPNIYIQDAVYKLDDLNAIRSNADLYVHTHSLCGTAPSLIEAMHLGLPVICFDVDTNRATTEEKSYYFKDVASLKLILSVIDDCILKQLGKDMQQIAESRYNWQRIVNLYKKCID